MGKEDILQFLQLVNYLEVLPATDCNGELKEIVKFCEKNKLLILTPDNNYIISDKGWALLNIKHKGDDMVFSFSQAASSAKQELLYWCAGIVVSGLMIYDIIVNHLMQ